MDQDVAVIGASGMLGLAVAEYFERRGSAVARITRAEFDIAREPVERLEPRLSRANRVVNCAGVIKPRVAGLPVEDVLRVNAIFPRNLALLCRRTGSNLIHVTTDCAYSGRKGRYTEEDYFDAEDLYGLSKNAGDAADCMVLRTSILGEERGQSRSLLEWARSQAGRPVNGFVNHVWNGVTTVYLAEIVASIFDQGLWSPGTFHVFSPRAVTKYELLQAIDRVYGLRLEVRPVEAPEACDRSLASVHPLASRVATRPLERQIEELREFFASVGRNRTAPDSG